MRIELKKNFNHVEVVEWMEKNVGPIEDGVTWFWSCGEIYEEPNKWYKGVMDQKIKPEGIKLFIDDPNLATLIALRWG